MVVGITQRWINTKIQFCCSYNLETYHRIYLWVISVSFLHFQSLLRFMKSQFSVTSSLLMKSSFLKSLFSFLFSFHYLIVVKFTFAQILTDCLMCLAENDNISKRANIFSKFLFINFTKLMFEVTLCKVWMNIKQVRKGVSMAPPSPTYLASKKHNLSETATGRQNLTGKHLCQSLLFNKVTSLRPATLLKKRLWHRCFPVNFTKFLKTPFLQNTFGRLLLTFEGSLNLT